MKALKTVAAFTIASLLCIYLCFGAQEVPNDNIVPEIIPEPEKADYSGFAQGEPIIHDASVSAGSAILCSSDGLLIYEKNADVPLPMASITKVMSVIVALENITDREQTVTVPSSAVGIEGSSVYLANGEQTTYKMLLYSAMLESANDAVTALAILVGGSEEAFVSMMNAKARELSMSSTSFKNPHGLSENEHFTTARDYAKLMAYAIKNHEFCKLISTKKIAFTKLDGSMTRVLSNHNRLLNTYKGMLGGKTGYTKLSGRTLVTSAERNGTVLICVTLNAPDDWNDHSTLLDLGFEAVRTVTFSRSELQTEATVAGGNEANLFCSPIGDISITVKQGDEISVTFDQQRILFAPVSKGETVGNVRFYKNGALIKEAPLVAEAGIDIPDKIEDTSSIKKKLIDLIKIGA